MKMNKLRPVFLLLAFCLLLGGCGRSGKKIERGYKVISELNKEEFHIAFREDDPLCDIITAALKEVAAEGHLSRLSTQYLGLDYSCLEADSEALARLEVTIPAYRKLIIGIQDGTAPLSSSRDDGSFAGLVPDLAELVTRRLGWEYTFMVIDSADVAAELGSGNVDLAWMGASMEGGKHYTLSPGWMTNSHQLVVRSDSKFSRTKDLNNKVIAITDSTARQALKENGLLDNIGALWTYDDLQSCFYALDSGDCDAMVIDSITADYYM